MRDLFTADGSATGARPTLYRDATPDELVEHRKVYAKSYLLGFVSLPVWLPTDIAPSGAVLLRERGRADCWVLDMGYADDDGKWWPLVVVVAQPGYQFDAQAADDHDEAYCGIADDDEPVFVVGEKQHIARKMANRYLIGPADATSWEQWEGRMAAEGGAR